jgi:hypothetical protein
MAGVVFAGQSRFELPEKRSWQHSSETIASPAKRDISAHQAKETKQL